MAKADPFKISRRLGQWRINRAFIEDAPYEAMMLLQTRVLILDAIRDWLTDVTIYRGQASEFEIVERGGEIPLYVPVFTVVPKLRPIKIAGMRWAKALGDLDTASIDYTGWYPDENYHFPTLSYLETVHA